jgi:hypothetical protein
MAPAFGAFVEAQELPGTRRVAAEVAVFGAQGVVLEAEELADLFKELQGTSRLSLPRASRMPGSRKPLL